MKHLKGLTTLETLVLNNTLLTDAGLAELKDLKKLKSLQLAGCIRVTDKSAEVVKGFTDLEDLSLPSTITGEGAKTLVGLKKLRKLYLGGAPMTDAAVKDIADNMPELTDLNLGSSLPNEVSDASVANLARLKKLKALNLSGSKLTDAGLKDLQKALPECKITR